MENNTLQGNNKLFVIQTSTKHRHKYNTINVLCFVHVSYLVISHPILQWLGYMYLSLVNSLWQTLGGGGGHFIVVFYFHTYSIENCNICSLFINFFSKVCECKRWFCFLIFIWDMHYWSSYWHRQFAIDCNPYNILIFFNEYWFEFLYDFILLSVSVSCKWRCWALAYPDHCLCELDSNSVDIEAASFEFIVVI